MKRHTLLIWEAIPEETVLYLLPNVSLSEEDHRVLHTANGHYINSTKGGAQEELEHINSALCEKKEHLGDAYQDSPWAMRWAKYKQDQNAALEDVYISHVYRCGFLL